MNNSNLNEMYDWLKSFMRESFWNDENVPEQTRAIFTTICLMDDIIADTSGCDTLLRELWHEASLKDVDVSYDEFEDYMVELIV